MHIIRATLATLFFIAAGVAALLFVAPPNEYVLPHSIFYAVLTLNTFFSIKLYATIQPNDQHQRIVDFLLVAAYVALAFSIGRAFEFSLVALILFIFATPKYAMMRGKIPHDALLRRKILIDLSGVAFTAVVFLGTIAGYPLESAWVLAIGFVIANIYHLVINPMYHL